MVSVGLKGLGETSEPWIYTRTGSHVHTIPFPEHGSVWGHPSDPKSVPKPPQPLGRAASRLGCCRNDAATKPLSPEEALG